MVQQSFHDRRQELAAEEFATRAHEGTFRKFDDAGEERPFIIHPRQVADRAQRLHLGSRAVQAAWLHDTIEDTDVTYADIYREFGYRVAQLVWGLTNVDARNPEHGLPNRAARKAADLEFLSMEEALVRMLKLIDLGVNMYDTPGREGFADVFMAEADLLGPALCKRGGIWPDVLAFYLRARRDLGERRAAWQAARRLRIRFMYAAEAASGLGDPS